MRWLKELFNPTLKCKRIGHVWDNKKYKIETRGNMNVIEEWLATRKECACCGKKMEMQKVEYITGYSGCSMPKYMWEKLDREGFLIL